MYKYAFNNTGVSIKKFKGSYGRQKELTTKDTKVNIKVWRRMNLVHWGRTRSLPQGLPIDSSSHPRQTGERKGEYATGRPPEMLAALFHPAESLLQEFYLRVPF